MELTMLVEIDKGNQDKGGNLWCLHYYYIVADSITSCHI